MKRIAVFPGSFDPITLGHRSIVLRALPMFDVIYVAVGVNMEKRSTFPLENRIQWAKRVFADYPNIVVESYDGLTADFCKKVGARFIIRGLRSGSDFEYENMICHANKRLHPELETVFLLTESELVGVSSSVVRDIYKNGGDTSKFVPEEVDLEEVRSKK
jgi:pantetheine-phosphate adenylyltransferase